MIPASHVAVRYAYWQQPLTERCLAQLTRWINDYGPEWTDQQVTNDFGLLFIPTVDMAAPRGAEWLYIIGADGPPKEVNAVT